MFKLGIIGYPLGHTLSPVMHEAALKEVGLKGSYIVLETKPEELDERIKQLQKEGFKGINVTIPYKVAILNYLSSLDKYSQLAGAVNTVRFNADGTIEGFNTDIYGFLNAFSEDQKRYLKDKSALILGAGGAARAVSIALATVGVSKLIFCVRAPEKAFKLKEEISQKFKGLKIEIQKLENNIDLNENTLVVNTTPIGMEGKYENDSPLSEFSIKTLAKSSIVYDLVYKPRDTKLIQLALKYKLDTIEGLEMLILQGAKAFEIWTKTQAPVDKMRALIQEKLS